MCSFHQQCFLLVRPGGGGGKQGRGQGQGQGRRRGLTVFVYLIYDENKLLYDKKKIHFIFTKKSKLKK